MSQVCAPELPSPSASRSRSDAVPNPEVMRAFTELSVLLQNDSPLPLYRQLSDQIKEWIEAGRLQPGWQLVSERNMSLMLRVSRRTVRAALADLIEGNYVSATHGCGNFVLTPPKQREIRILALERFRKEDIVSTPQHHDLIHESEQRLNVSVHYKYAPSLENLREILKSPPSGYHGILLYRPPQDWIDQLSGGNLGFSPEIPTLVGGREVRDSEVHFVSPDHFGQTYAAAKKLIALGHRRIGYISGMLSQEYMRDARQGFVSALQEASLALENEDELILEAWGRPESERAIHRFISNRKFGAVVVAGSAYSIHFEDAVQRAAIHIPGELSAVLVTENLVLERSAMRWTAIVYPDEVVARSLEVLAKVAMNPLADRVQELIPFHDVAGATVQSALL